MIGSHYLAVLPNNILNDIMSARDDGSKKCKCCLIVRHEEEAYCVFGRQPFIVLV